MAAAVFLLCFGWGGVLSCSNGSDGNNNEGNKNGASEKIENDDGTITLKMQENGGGFVSTTGSIKTAETNWIGYSGGGFIENLVKGTSVVYTVTAAQTITDAKITIHYANWQESNVRGAYVYVNGTLINENNPISLTYTNKGTQGQIVDGRWADSGDLTDVTLTAGSNVIEIKGVPATNYTTFVKTAKDEAEKRTILEVNNDGQLSNIDYLIVTGKGIDFGTDTTPYYTFSYASENKTAGSVTSETAPGSAKSGTEITVSAKANDGWKFECWSDGATENPHTFKLTKNTAIFAHFIPNNYTSPSGLVGYATITDDAGAKYTITGGAGGETIEIASLDVLKANADKLSSDVPYIVHFTSEKRFTTADNKSECYTIGSNKTMYGKTKGAGLKNIEMRVTGSNVIIRNLVFGEVIGDDTFGGTGNDALSLNGAKHVWVDHCELFSHLDPKNNDGTDAGVTEEKAKKDWYDGLLDVKNGAAWITVSNCYFHDHWKAVLCGSSDKDENGDRAIRITFVGNYWENINSRQPLFRWGKAHIFNNYFKGAAGKQANCIDVRIDSQVWAEGNYFDTVKDAIGLDLANGGKDSTGKAAYRFTGTNKCVNAPTPNSGTLPETEKPRYDYTPKSADEAKADAAALKDSIFLENL
ncbi:MAG: hypothetical protein K2M90_07405 [Treponemataceae bacterium]|nr:hypothetical protein [Treponemataceae bacterium]